MGSIGRYIFRTTIGAFVIVLASLTMIIWITQALRDIDLITSQGQTILVFVAMTSLAIPQLVLVIAPIALFIAVAHVLNKLASDSEIIVINSAGMSPWRLARAFLAVALVVSVLVAIVSAYLSPKCLRELRRWVSEVRADLVANIVQPGRFLVLEHGLLFHIRERQANGILLGIFVDDRRNPREESTFLAERGEIVEDERGTFLVLENGSLQRHRPDQRDPTIVNFDRYPFDLSRFSVSGPSTTLSVRERYLWELAAPAPDDPAFNREPAQFRAELHDRLLAPLYPLAFTVIAFAFLGPPRTTRQSRAMAVVSAIAAVAALRLLGFASMVFAIYMPAALAIQYVALAAVFWFGLSAVSRGTMIEPPAWIVNLVAVTTERLSRRFATS